jgi:hypothetical protein
MRLRFFGPLLLAVLCGCNSKPYSVALVSGRVTLDGKPLAKASITFVPMATKENIAPGPTATALTDADGRYTLTVDKDTPGSVVGRCRIFVTTMFTDAPPPPPDQDGGPPVRLARDKVPERYNVRTTLTFDVPPSGTDQADFDLKSR